MSLPKSLVLRHIKTIGIIVAFHSFLYAIGYLTGVGGFTDTVLYDQVIQLLDPRLFGLGFLLTSIAILAGYFVESVRLVGAGSTAQSFIWIFVTLIYIINGNWLVSLALGAIWVILSSYTAFVYRNKKREDNLLIVREFLDT